MSEGWTEGGKGLNDPCPVGYRVPTAAEWQSLLAYVDGNAAKNQDSGDKPLPMYDWKAGDATGEGTYYERKMTTAYGMRCVKE